MPVLVAAHAKVGQTLVAKYNAKLVTHPYTIKASTTAATYFLADLTAQGIEGERLGVGDRAARSLKFAAVGGLWVGPLLTKWFLVMEHALPGRGPRAVAAKLALDQLVQGPLMIGSMFAWCAALNGAGARDIGAKLEEELYPTWLSSVAVWGPVQVVQQAYVPLAYRVAVANAVSFFWDTYLSLAMMRRPEGAQQAANAPLARFDTAVYAPRQLARRASTLTVAAPREAAPEDAGPPAAAAAPAGRRVVVMGVSNARR